MGDRFALSARMCQSFPVRWLTHPAQELKSCVFGPWARESRATKIVSRIFPDNRPPTHIVGLRITGTKKPFCNWIERLLTPQATTYGCKSASQTGGARRVE